MRVYYSDTFVLPLPSGHRFPMAKYRRVRERCLAEGLIDAHQLEVPPAAEWHELALVHTPDYLERVGTGTLTAAEQREIGFPWSPQMVERSRRSVGATIAAARRALAERTMHGWGIALNLAGGTHHAHADRGAGFCVFNDAAVAIRVVSREMRLARVAVVDCDVHQGNGSASIFARDPAVLTFSIHGARNYPFRRERSTIDIDMPDGAGDEEYLTALAASLPAILDDFDPSLVIYLAGADPFEGDTLGRLSLTMGGLERRDELVLGACRSRAVPVVVTMAGGYAADVEATVSIHVNTVRVASRLWREAVRMAPHHASGGDGLSPLEIESRSGNER